MELKDQVCSLKLAQKLKELGVKQESWIWWDTDDNTLIQTDDGYAPTFSTGDARRKGGGRWVTDMGRVTAAFTVAELGEMIPDTTYTYKSTKYGWWYTEWPKSAGRFAERTEAAARAKMLIYLLENKLLPN